MVAPQLRSTRARHAERGFTVVEMMVVLLIALILMGLAIIAFRGAKSSTYAKETVAAGSTYVQAVSGFQSDHANKNPTSADLVNASQPGMGFKNLLGKPYTAQPDAVANGRIGVSFNANCGTAATAPSGSSNERGWISICPVGAGPDFGIRVLARGSDNQWNGEKYTLCWLGSTANAPRC
ncbi:MAG: type II secretion system protein [Thermoleophilia bacterium]|nr:type II secretion system protein [Thermoleophilia bacterium]